tara:strand:+ start:104 stop:382 length:279 start_codon:yes stop_codon:yes gene_type:complete
VSTLRGTYKVIVKIENKPFIKDPEGEVILRDLLMKNDYKQVSNVSTAKLLKFEVKADDSENAKKIIKEICDELRIYNPLVSNCIIELEKEYD